MFKNLNFKNSIKIKNCKLKIILLLLLCIFAYWLLPSAYAQTQPALNLTVFPATIDLTAQPGSTVTQKIRVRNNASSPIDFALATSKLSTDAKGNVVPVDTHDSYLSWISYSPGSFTARPNEWTDIIVTIKIPSTAAFGYYAAIRITPTNASIKNKTNGSMLIGQALVPLLLDVKKAGTIANIQLVSFAPTQSLYEYLPATLNITFVNKGNIHIRPQGNVFVNVGGSNNDTAVLDFNTSNGAMLPGEKRTYTATWDDGFLVKEPIIQDTMPLRDKNGNLKTQLVVHWDRLPAFRIGQYTAHLLAVYDNGTRDVPIEATVTFWVFPWKMILGSLLGIVILIFIARIWLKWYVAQEIRKQKST